LILLQYDHQAVFGRKMNTLVCKLIGHCTVHVACDWSRECMLSD